MIMEINYLPTIYSFPHPDKYRARQTISIVIAMCVFIVNELVAAIVQLCMISQRVNPAYQTHRKA
jgi:hypothetical protein